MLNIVLITARSVLSVCAQEKESELASLQSQLEAVQAASQGVVATLEASKERWGGDQAMLTAQARWPTTLLHIAVCPNMVKSKFDVQTQGGCTYAPITRPQCSPIPYALCPEGTSSSECNANNPVR